MSRHGVMTFKQVSFSYDGADALFSKLDLDLHRGFTGCVGANGAGKTTLLKLAVGELRPSQGVVRGGGIRCYCPQRTDEPPEGLLDFLRAMDPESCVLRGRLHLDESYAERWPTLSHGERKRCQIGTALWHAPDVLAIDEPTNHIDSAARSLLTTALRGFRGIGLLVSHDRELLDSLCRHCLWLEPPSVEVHRGGYSEASQRRAEIVERDRSAYERARLQRDRVQREVRRRREEASRSHHERSKRGLAIKDHDARGRKNRARVSGKDGGAGRRYKQLLGRAAQAEQRLRAVARRKQFDQGITLAGTPSRRDLVMDVQAGVLPLGARRLFFDAIRLPPTARVAVTGPNGAGKSTLLHHLHATLRLPPEEVLFLPQELAAREAERVLREAKRLPHAQLGRVMTFIRRLGSRPRRLLDSSCPSPGELRKLLLAMGMARQPRLLLLDEPTNHLDLPSIECLEGALAECPCALLLVSHDESFLGKLTVDRWDLAPAANGDSHLRASRSSVA